VLYFSAAYSIDTKPELIQDPATQVQFVVRIATALKDKPKVQATSAARGGRNDCDWN
jgi:hypothetical protein